MTTPVRNKVDAGQAIYNKPVLSIYDLWVLGFSNTYVWKCPTKLLRKEFRQHSTTNHLDVGVGTGYYLDKCLNTNNRRVALLDLNANSLAAAAKRVRRFKPEVYQANILEPLNLSSEKFDSISLNYLLHCLPDPIKTKSVIFKNLIPYANANATIFGSTILNDNNVNKNRLAQRLMTLYNKKGIFGNNQDNLQELSEALNTHFSKVDIKIIGCVAIFSAKYIG